MAGPVNLIAYGKPCPHCTTQLEGQADMDGLALCGRCGNGGDGLLQRFQLVVWIEGLGEWKAPDSWPNSAAKEDAYQAALSLDSCARRLQIQERLTRQIGELLAQRGGRSLVLGHRDELIRQAADKLKIVAQGLDISVVKAAENELAALVIVASVQTRSRSNRLGQFYGNPEES
jgi:hypothetical protein